LASRQEGDKPVGFSDLTLLLIDPRDKVLGYALPGFHLRLRPEPLLRIAVAGGQEQIALRQGQEQEVTFELQATRQDLLAQPLVPQFDSTG